MRKAMGADHAGAVSPGIMAALFLWLFAGVPGLAQESEREETMHASAVVAVVNGKPITFGEVWERVHRVLEDARTRGNEEQFRAYARKLLDMGRQDLIGRQLLLDKAEELDLRVTERQIERYAEHEMKVLNQEEGANLVSLEDFWEARTEQTGLSEKKYREEIRARVLITLLLQEDVWEPEYFSPELVRRFYREHSGEFRAGGYVVVRHIYVRREEAGYPAIVKGIMEKIARGEDFERIARDAYQAGHSRRKGRDGAGRYHFLLNEEEGKGGPEAEPVDGLLDEMLLEPMPSLVRSLRIGETSQPFTTPQGTHFFKLEERAGGRVREFDEVQLHIQRRLARMLEDQTKMDYINRLEKNADIDRLDFPEETPLGRISAEPPGKVQKPVQESPSRPAEPPAPGVEEPPESPGEVPEARP